ncbi:MAG TPA: sugar ABC transporter permease [Propionibacteriaceae bacterium]|nr:sugar ABC transporter permease [Propionibacteriaceae bacterium]
MSVEKAAAPGQSGLKRLVSHALQNLGPLLALVLLCIIAAIASPVFLSPRNILNVLRQSSINAIIAAGMTLTILTAGIDLSVGSVVALASTTMGLLMIHHGAASSVAIGGALILAAFVGVINGLVITKMRVPPFIATLGMMSIARGAALEMTRGYPMFGLTQDFRWMGAGEVGPIPWPVIITLVLYVIVYLILRFTKIGLYAYGIGGNEQAAVFSGINVDRYKIVIYMLCAFLAGIAGIVLSARLDSAQPGVAEGFELDAVAAVVIGGTSLFGGEGTIWGTLIGALTMGVIRNLMNLMEVSAFWQRIVIGAVIILAVFVDQMRRRVSRRT